MTTCREWARTDTIAGYLAGEMGEAEREAFELHYFACEGCYGRVAQLEALQIELARSREGDELARSRGAIERPGAARSYGRSRAKFAATAAAFLAASLAIVWFAWRPAAVDRPGSEESFGTIRGHAAAGSPVGQPHGVDPARARLASLGAFELPDLVASAAPRGSRNVLDFERGLDRYRARDYAAAAAAFARAAGSQPPDAHARYCEGVSLLLDGRTGEGVSALRAALDGTIGADQENVRFFLAKGLLRAGDATEAAGHLETIIAMHGAREREAAALLTALRAG